MAQSGKCSLHTSRVRHEQAQGQASFKLYSYRIAVRPTCYETIFGKTAEVESPKTDGDILTAPEISTGSGSGVWTPTGATKSHKTYMARPGAEYLVTTMYDEESEVFSGKEVAEWCMAQLEKVMATYYGDGKKKRMPELIKKWVGPVTHAEFKGEKGGGLLGRVHNGTVKIVCYADPALEGAEEGAIEELSCKAFEELCSQNDLLAMRRTSERSAARAGEDDSGGQAVVGTLRPGTAREHPGTLRTSRTPVRVLGRVSRPGCRRCIPDGL